MLKKAVVDCRCMSDDLFIFFLYLLHMQSVIIRLSSSEKKGNGD